LSTSPADCKKLSIYSQHPSPQGEGTSGNPTASGLGIKKIKDNKELKKIVKIILDLDLSTVYVLHLWFSLTEELSQNNL
jgi:hypothetical protein